MLASLCTTFAILWSAHGSVKARMHDLISFSVSQITLLDTCRELRYVSDGSSSLMPSIAGRLKSSPALRPFLDRYIIPITML